MSEAQTLDYRSSGNGGESDPVYYGLPLSVWFKTGVVASLVCAVFWPNLRRLWEKTNPFYGEANWGHAVCVPLIGLYYLYVNRDSLRSAPVKTSWWGLLVLLVGILVFGYGIWPGQNDFVKDFGMVVTLFGVVLLLAGWRVMKVAWFPIAFLICAIPWPGLVYSWIASPLQQLAANVAVSTLQLTGVKSFAGGTKIFIYGHEQRPPHAQRRRGLRRAPLADDVHRRWRRRSAFLSARPLWQKIVVIVSAVPIAIFCNVMRVAGQGLLDHYVSQELSESFAHQFVGLIMLIPAFLLILLVGWVLDQIFIEELTHRRELATKVVRKPQIEAVPLSAGAVRAAGGPGGRGESRVECVRQARPRSVWRIEPVREGARRS